MLLLIVGAEGFRPVGCKPMMKMNRRAYCSATRSVPTQSRSSCSSSSLGKTWKRSPSPHPGLAAGLAVKQRYRAVPAAGAGQGFLQPVGELRVQHLVADFNGQF